MTEAAMLPLVQLRGSRLRLLAELAAVELLAGRAVHWAIESRGANRVREATTAALCRRTDSAAAEMLLARLTVGDPLPAVVDRYLRTWWLPVEAELSEDGWTRGATPVHQVDPRPASSVGMVAFDSGVRYRLAPVTDDQVCSLSAVVGAVTDVVAELRGRGVAVPVEPPRQLAGDLPLVRSADAADALVRLADRGGGPCRTVLPAAHTSGALLWRLLCAGLRIPAPDGGRSAAAGLATGLLERRLAPLTAAWATTEEGAPGGWGPLDRVVCTPPSEADLTALVEGIRQRNRQQGWAATDLGRLREPATSGGLPYLTAGTDNPTVVVVNALGQRLAPWLPLVAERLPYRTLVWQPAGTHRLDEQVADLAGALAAEEVDRCCLLGWCSGAKIATRLWRRQPRRVAALVLLAADFRDRRRPAELDSPHEKNLHKISEKLAEQPELAEWIVGMFEHQIAAADKDALFGPPLALLPDIRRPFGSAAALVEYADQLRDFWAAEELACLDQIDGPVLSIIGDHDSIVVPATAAVAASRFRAARHVELPDTTHYLMYERPRLLAAMVAAFLDEAGLLGAAAGDAGQPAAFRSLWSC